MCVFQNTLPGHSNSYFLITTSMATTMKISNEEMEQIEESSIKTPFFYFTAYES